MSRNRRSAKYKKYWHDLIEAHGSNCFYCGIRAATTIDHITPVAYIDISTIDNLVPACALCNGIASDKVFENVWAKRSYILDKLKKQYQTVAECTDCLLLFQYLIDSPSQFLCPVCYDREYETEYSQRKTWNRWLNLLRAAGVDPEAHEEPRKSHRYSRKAKIQMLADYYSVEFRPDALAIPVEVVADFSRDEPESEANEEDEALEIAAWEPMPVQAAISGRERPALITNFIQLRLFN